MESEPLGHVRGAFTGAADAKRWLIEPADGGTAFFDEIGDLPLEMQVKLLRLLQEPEFRAVGSLTTRRVEIRVIAATHPDLLREIEQKNLRQDLFYRLNVVTLRLPPLRECREDIPSPIERFLDRSGARHALTNETMQTLMPQNCIGRMLAMNSGPLLHIHDLPSTLQTHRLAQDAGALAVAAVAAAGPEALRSPAQSGIISLKEMEKRAISATP